MVDPVRAVQEPDLADPPSSPTPDPGAAGAEAPDVAPFSLAQTPAERDEHRAAYALGITAVLITVITGTAVTLRDLRRRRARARRA